MLQMNDIITLFNRCARITLQNSHDINCLSVMVSCYTYYIITAIISAVWVR